MHADAEGMIVSLTVNKPSGRRHHNDIPNSRGTISDDNSDNGRFTANIMRTRLYSERICLLERKIKENVHIMKIN